MGVHWFTYHNNVCNMFYFLKKGKEPNDRKIGKLYEYARKNPLRVPRITSSPEHRYYKELRNENF